MPKIISDYSQTIIYKICCKDPSINEIYIGHTTNFTNRKHNHKSNCRNSNLNNYNLFLYKFIRENGDWDNWSMIQIEYYNCSNKREAEMRERYWIETLKPKLNCINPITLKEEKQKQKHDWYEEKKDFILQKAKQNYEENKEQKIEYQKQYAQENKEHIKNYQDEYREKNKEKLAEQKKEYREAHKEEASVKQKQWREANKEKLKEQRGQILLCDCGMNYTHNNKSRHLKTKNHLKFVESISEN